MRTICFAFSGIWKTFFTDITADALTVLYQRSKIHGAVVFSFLLSHLMGPVMGVP